MERDDYDEDLDPEQPDAVPSWFAGQHLPPDARTMGLTALVPDGALLDFAGRLDASKTKHKITAWLLLFVFGMPVVFYLLRLTSLVLGA